MVLTREVPDDPGDRGQLILGCHAVGGTLDDPRGDLLFEARDTDLEELIEVAAEDREELEALEQRRSAVECLMQHATVELEPGELAIQVERRVSEVDRDDRGFGLEEVGHVRNVGPRARSGNEL